MKMVFMKLFLDQIRQQQASLEQLFVKFLKILDQENYNI